MMSNDNDCTVSHDACRILGEVPAIPGESAASYDELLTRMTETLKPGDLIEEVWVRDIVDMTWDILRLRRLKAGLLAGGARHGLDNLRSGRPRRLRHEQGMGGCRPLCRRTRQRNARCRRIVHACRD